MSTKSSNTRETILDRSVELASRVGLSGLSIGSLAAEVEMSKSGLFAHFGSKEQLQLDTLQRAAERFVDRVVRPALAQDPGEPRVLALAERWIEWAKSSYPRSGCLFVQAATEFDDQPGSVRELLVRQQRQWMDVLAGAAERASSAGHFRSDLDPRQFAYEIYAVMLGYYHQHRLLHDPLAEGRLRQSLDSLIARSRA